MSAGKLGGDLHQHKGEREREIHVFSMTLRGRWIASLRSTGYSFLMIKEIRQHLDATPFEPFEIRSSNGEVYRVGHPENAAVVGGRVIVARADGEGVHVLSALHIVAVSGAERVS
jgi:hypothetical protein